MTRRKHNGVFQDLLEAGSRTTYHGKIRGRSSGKPRASVSRGKQRTYKGVQIIPLGGGEYTISIDRDSRFESVRDAKKVIDHMKGNPGASYRGRSVAELERIRPHVAVREYANDFRDRMHARNELAEIDRALANARKREAKKGIGNPRGSTGKFERCVKSVAQRGGAYDPRAVCGAMEKRLKRKKNPEYWAYSAEGHRLGSINADSKREAQKIANRWYPEYVVKIRTERQNPAAGAIAVSEEFHGRKVKQMVPVQETRHYHKYLADLGELTKLVVVTRDGKGKVTLTGFKGAMLTCNEAKDQLFITGGDQTVNPKDFGIDHPHEVETLGEVVTIEYFTDKHHLGSEGGTATYTHKFRSTNENGKHVTVRTARNPDLIYRKRDKCLEFSGGSYLIRKEGIDL